MRRRMISGKPSIPCHLRYALAVFVVGMIIGVIVTDYVAGRLASAMPAGDSFDAIRRENRAFEYSLIGWGITFVASAALAVGVGLRMYDPNARQDR